MSAAAPNSCATCGVGSCAMNAKAAPFTMTEERSAMLLDDVWPEYAAFVGAVRRPEDSVIAPGIFGQPRLSRYRWPGAVTHAGSRAVIARHLAMRRVANARGAERQRVYLQHDERVAHALAAQIDYRTMHLVVAQSWLPWLSRAGVLGGRSYDVLMSRYPFGVLHDRLDAFAAVHPESATIADFRADDRLVDDEAAALAGARHIITPHHDIAALFRQQARRLDWHGPAAQADSPPATGSRVAFLGPTIARQGAYQAREFARHLPEPLIVVGAQLEGADFWDGIAIERRSRTLGWLDDVGAVIHPAAITHQPRELLSLAARGITIFANESCGLSFDRYRPLDRFTREWASACHKIGANRY